MKDFESRLIPSERRLLADLDSPAKIQTFLNTIHYSEDKFYRCPLRVLRDRKAHCFDGALFAAMALRRLGCPPLILELLPNIRDDDHLLALFKWHGHWGAVAQSNFTGLRYREPIYRSLRELAMSYFEDFFNTTGEKTLRGYRRPVNLTTFDRLDWMSSDAGLEALSDGLDRYRTFSLITDEMAAGLAPLDERSLHAGLLGANRAGLFKVHPAMTTFTSRVAALEAEGAYAVLARAQALEAQGRKILHLEIGQPDFSTPANVSEAGISAIRAGKTKYTPPAGIPKFREIIADYAGRQRDLKIDPAQVVVGAGSKPGLFFSTLALVAAGDEVIYPDPGFPTYAAMIRVAGGTPVPIPLREENQFSFDLDTFDAKISTRTKLIVLNSPANPTGGVIPLGDLKHIAEKAQKHNCWVLSDEIYTRLVYDGVLAHSIAGMDGMLERTVIVDGFSKTYSMTGWRLGYMIAPVTLAERLELLITHAAGCTATFTQYAGMEALTGPQDFVAGMVAEYQRHRDRMVAGLNAIPGISCQVPQGAFYVFPKVKSFGLLSQEIARRLLDEAGVAVLAGTDFGAGGEGYLRLCYATSVETIDRALEKMGAFFSAML